MKKDILGVGGAGVGLLQFQIDTQTIIAKLDKIIELLKFRNSIQRARDEMRKGSIYIDPSEVFPDNSKEHEPLNDDFVQAFSIDCICGKHNRGGSTGGWLCPIHGQQF